MRIVHNHGDLYLDEIEPRPIVMEEGSVNKHVMRIRVNGAWGTFTIDQYSDGSMICTPVANSLGRRSTATPLELRYKH